MADVKMVVVNGVRYRAEDAPKEAEQAEETKPVEHKMRQPRTKAKG